MNKEKDVLDEIIGLGCVSHDPQRNSADEPGVAAKQGRQRFPARKANFGDQGLVRKAGFVALRFSCARLLLGYPEFWQANCDRTIHNTGQRLASLSTSVIKDFPALFRAELGSIRAF